MAAFVVVTTPTLAIAPLGTFTGDFALTPPSPGVYNSSQNFGLWSGSITGNGQIDTTSAPFSVGIFAFPQLDGFRGAFNPMTAPVPEPGQSITDLTMYAPHAGIFRFTYTATGAGLTAFSGEGSVPLMGSGTLVLDLSVNEHFGFRAIADTVLPPFSPAGRGIALPAAPGNQALIVSQIQPVPEASTVLGGVAILGLAAGGFVRNRRTS